MGFFDKLKKSVEIKQAGIDSKSNQKSLDKIPKLQKQLEEDPDNFDLVYQLYGCYVDLSNSEKKIECLKKMHILKPKDSFPLSQLASIYYSELQDPERGKFYQDKANKMNSNKFL
jgi:tetratricopeptide (TPR) repeat protein